MFVGAAVICPGRRRDPAGPGRAAVHRRRGSPVRPADRAAGPLDGQPPAGLRRLYARPRHQRPARRHCRLRPAAGFR